VDRQAVEVGIARVATGQRNLITTQQLRGLGLSKAGISRRVEAGRLHPRHRGVYVVGTELLLPGARELSAALSAGDECWVSHRSAGLVYRALEKDAGDVDITVARGGREDRDGIRFHRSVCLGDDDVGAYDGIPITSPARTLLDLATVLARGELAWAYNEMLIQHLVTPAAVRELLGRTHGHPGSGRLEAIVERDDDPRRTKGRLAALVRAALDRAGVQRPEEDEDLYGWEVDFYWPEHGLVLEADGYQFHSGPESWRRDRRKQADLESRGLRVLRTDWDEVTQRPESMVARVVGAQAERSGSASPATSAATTPAPKKARRASAA
jgi:very-short-patch-repair endonuclease